MVHTTYLTIPNKYKKGMRQYFLTSARINLFSFYKKKLNENEVIPGFIQRYKTGRIYDGYVDGAIDWYQTPLYHCEAHFSNIPNTKDIVALDLGCGPASVCVWLRNNDYKWSYVGVDAAKEAETYFSKLTEATFLAKRAESLKQEDFLKKPDIIFAVNFLSYISDKKKLLQNIKNLSDPSAKLVIIDPHSSLFWNRLTPNYFISTPTWKKVLHESGWHIEKVFRLSIYNIANIPLMNISQGFLCSKK